ncbi:ATP-dependent RNA helicase SUPV3L1/SUV3 [Devosia lucknowensis]|uniref:ATP-dependent RNA helicase SUPV3L1/SUV3 n=1 Tax=Devosia lucknowensis TaxID=1096929 RepID=A0A1Y6GC76_9HYPH|nr:helicase-related protein [Devosia lucknowensis]SMQ86328.1 ATP-dependent RNA helicase SUPV3L1/SUV3 [Devosia lucknowensis]
MSFSPAHTVKAILGPTNTGKTYYAIERMLAHPTGMIGLPLRLLAREVYQRVVERVGEQAVALITGEERIVPVKPRYWVATVEAMPMDIHVDCVAIDEIQTAIDFDRGHVFTDRILKARGFHETLLLGSGTMANVVKKLVPHVEIIDRPRFSQLTYAGSKKISRQPPRSAIVAFSARQVYAIAELIRRERGGAAVVMGALSPRTRNAQVELYQNGDVDFLVATDAIGMGLNLDIHHVAFADDTKFDGHQSRPLTPAELGQIAGRAGRHRHNGTFGVTGGTENFDEELVVQLETHDFEPVRQVQWRNSKLDFSSIERLRHSLEEPPEDRTLTRVPVAKDQHALEFVARNEAGALARGHDAVKLLWECCQIPDYQGISPAAHGEIVTRIYSDLKRNGSVKADWIAEQVRFCDNAEGDIDTLSNRIKQIRTWTFVANRKNWLEDPTYWREKTRDIEDRLSDALHERLTQRFVDRRTSVLLRHLKDKRMVSPEINERGEVRLEGHLIGTLEGFRFTLARNDGDVDAKGLRSAADSVVAPEIGHRAERLAGSPNEEFVLATDGRLRWRGEIVAELAEGDSLYRPRIIMLADETLTGPDLEKVQDRLSLWLRHHINTVLEQVMTLEAPADIDGTARGLAYQLFENIGLLPRSAVADEVKGLDQDVRGKLRKLGIKFGAYHLYLPLSLKPAPRELALILFALKHGGIRQPGVTDIPHIVLSGRTSFVVDPEVDARLYEVAGFKVAGGRAVRVDILERLADIIRPLIAIDAGRPYAGDLPAGAAEGNGFRVTVEMTSLLGCSGEDFASILTSLGYRVRRTPKTAAAVPAEASAEVPALEASLDAVAATVDPVDEPAVIEPPAPLPDVAEGAVPDAAPADAAPAEPEFDEVWFPGRRNSEQRRHEPRGRRDSDAEGQQGRRNDRARPSGKGPRRPEGEVQDLSKARHLQKGKGRPDNRRPDDQKGERARFQPQREERKEKAFDPDSPFAKLMALKAPKGQ